MRMIASVMVEALLSATIDSARADELGWGPLSSQPKDSQNPLGMRTAMQ